MHSQNINLLVQIFKIFLHIKQLVFFLYMNSKHFIFPIIIIFLKFKFEMLDYQFFLEALTKNDESGKSTLNLNIYYLEKYHL